MSPGSSFENLRRSTDSGPETRALERLFGDALRTGNGRVAERVVKDALEAGLAPQAVQSLVIEPAMVRIGELWASGHISVADEHLATAISQRSLIGLFEALCAERPSAGSGRRALLAGVEGQHHVLGLRMVADVLEGAGFDVQYLGGDVPIKSLRDFASEHQPSVTGLAFGIATQVSHLADSLFAVHEAAPDTRIMLGGGAVPPGFRDAGYPVVRNSMEVERVVESLLAGPPQPFPALVEALRSRGEAMALPREEEIEEDAVAGELAQAADDAVELARRQVRRAEKYRDLALRDVLTDMPNRRAFEDALSTHLERSGPEGMILLIDVDSFKAVNDEHGHEAGDRLLRAVGGAIGDSLRPNDFAARFGGDEFIALLPGASATEGRAIGDRIRTAVSDRVIPPVTVSIGVASLDPDSRRTVLAADVALYEAKAAGRDRVVGGGESR